MKTIKKRYCWITQVFLLSSLLILSACAKTNYSSDKMGIFPKEFSENAAPYFMDGKNGEAVLLVHGWTGTPAHLRELGNFLNENGYTVSGILLSGHGTTLNDMKKQKASDWFNDVEKAYKELAKTYDKISVVGLSMGGSLALYLAAKYPLKSAVCIAPALIPANKQAYLVPFIRFILPEYRFRPDYKFGVDEAYSFSHEYVGSPTDSIPQLLKVGRIARKNLKMVTEPVLVIQSVRDESVDNSVPELIMKNIKTNTENKALVMLDDSRHISTIDKERTVILEETLKFIEKY